jgi:hypothetical protein
MLIHAVLVLLVVLVPGTLSAQKKHYLVVIGRLVPAPIPGTSTSIVLVLVKHPVSPYIFFLLSLSLNCCPCAQYIASVLQ